MGKRLLQCVFLNSILNDAEYAKLT
jgi:hypothetical protein